LTQHFCCRYSDGMFGRRILGVLVVAVLLLLGISGCLISATSNAQAAQCCAQLTCTPGQQKPSCLATTAPSDGPQTVPVARTSLAAPSVTVDLNPPAAELVLTVDRSTSVADASQHSPPELYTLHLALLI
jgi:hypothetical protein